ncbi:hypothetical protein GN956_G26316 [Arapaima gigas]
MKLATQVVSVLCISCLLMGVQCRPAQEKKVWTLDLARNRELFLSALQSYFNDKGLNIDRSAPDFFRFPDKSQQIYTGLLSATDFGKNSSE